MKKSIIIIIGFVISVTSDIFSQSKEGMVEFSISGPVYKSTSYKTAYGSKRNVQLISPKIGLSVFNDKYTSANFTIAALKQSGYDGIGFEGSIGANAHYPIEKFWPFIGIRGTLQVGDVYLGEKGAKKYIGGLIGLKYWPMQDGAIVMDASYDKNNSDWKVGLFKVNLGLLIRLK